MERDGGILLCGVEMDPYYSLRDSPIIYSLE